MKNYNLTVHSIETFGTHEGPGIRLVVFLQGCEFRCLYCHNPDSISKKGGIQMSIGDVLEKVEKEKIFFGNNGGVTISGGEPMLQAKELIFLFKKLKDKGIHTVIDSNGFIFNDDVEELLKYTDLVLLDIKQIDSRKHKILTGVANEKVLNFAKYLEKNNKKFWIRHVLVPGYTDAEKDLRELGKFLQNFINLERLEILPYHTLGVYKRKELGMEYKLGDTRPPTKVNIDKAKKIFEKYIQKVIVRS